MCCVCALGRWLVVAGACGLRDSFGGRVVVSGCGGRAALRFGVGARVDQDGVPALPGLLGRPDRARFAANSGSCATVGLSGLLALCVAAVGERAVG